MLIKGLIFALSLVANVWLLGQWTLDESMGQSLLLLVDTGLMCLLVGWPIATFFKNGNFKAPLKTKTYFAIFVLYVALTVLLSVLSFQGLMRLFLPINLILIAFRIFMRFKPSKSRKTPTISENF